MDTIKAIQIIMAAASASIIKEIYDLEKQKESLSMFITEILMSTLVGTIGGFIVQSYIHDIMYVMGIAAGLALQGIDGFNKIFSIVVSVAANVKSADPNLFSTENKQENKDDIIAGAKKPGRKKKKGETENGTDK